MFAEEVAEVSIKKCQNNAKRILVRLNSYDLSVRAVGHGDHDEVNLLITENSLLTAQR